MSFLEPSELLVWLVSHWAFTSRLTWLLKQQSTKFVCVFLFLTLFHSSFLPSPALRTAIQKILDCSDHTLHLFLENYKYFKIFY